jgi:hypothetical protein
MRVPRFLLPTVRAPVRTMTGSSWRRSPITAARCRSTRPGCSTFMPISWESSTIKVCMPDRSARNTEIDAQVLPNRPHVRSRIGSVQTPASTGRGSDRRVARQASSNGVRRPRGERAVRRAHGQGGTARVGGDEDAGQRAGVRALRAAVRGERPGGVRRSPGGSRAGRSGCAGAPSPASWSCSPDCTPARWASPLRYTTAQRAAAARPVLGGGRGSPVPPADGAHRAVPLGR